MTSKDEVTGETEAFSPWRVGIHTSIAGSFEQAAETAHHLACNTFQIFSSSPRMWKTRDPRPEEIAALRRARERYDLRPLVILSIYLIIMASPEPALRRRSLEAFRGEISRARALGAEYLVFHPGSSRNSPAEAGIRQLGASLRVAARETPIGPVTLLVENTDGQGSSLGSTFEQLRDILARLDGLPAGCCLDVAHCFAAGMDVSGERGLEKVVRSLDRIIGLERVKVIHTNDSRSGLGSHLDRHANIGEGYIGRGGFKTLVTHPAFRHLPAFIETPGFDREGPDRRNLQLLKRLRASSPPKPRMRISRKHRES
jgi:deoxyribonuclease-4